MVNLTYFLGAGASYNALPIVNQIPDRLSYLSRYIKDFRDKLDFEIEVVDKYLKKINELIGKLRVYTSVDNYAHWLYDNKDYDRLSDVKMILSGLFLFEQMQVDSSRIRLNMRESDPDFKDQGRVINRVDGRYYTFMNDFMGARSLKGNLNVLSWNYDIQMELAAQGQNSILLAMQYLNVFPPYRRYKYNDDQPSLIKINGTAGSFIDSSNRLFAAWDRDVEPIIVLNEIINMQKLQDNRRFSGVNNGLTFSFEANKPITEEAILRAKRIMSETEILVIIGYSFDKGNWRVDQRIFEQTDNIKKAYIQCVEEDFLSIITDKLPVVAPGLLDKLEYKSNLSEFFVPPEAGDYITN